MDVTEELYRKRIATFRPLIANVIAEYPMPADAELPLTRNLKYIIDKEKYSHNLPSQFYEDVIEEIKNMMNDSASEVRLLGLRLGRCLPFVERVRLIGEAQNELSMFMNKIETQVAPPAPVGSPDKKGGNADKKGTGMAMANTGMGGGGNLTSEFHYEAVADMSDLLLSVYELTSLSEEIYFDVNQKVSAIFTRILEQCLSPNRDIARNCFEALRAIFLVFGEFKGRNRVEQSLLPERGEDPSITVGVAPLNKLISKIISIFSKQQNYEIPSLVSGASTLMSSSNYSFCSTNPILRQLILKTREYEVRVRCRMLTGLALMLSHISEPLPELYDLLSKQVFLIMHNANEFDINLECFTSIKAILALPISQSTRTSIIRNWAELLAELAYSYKKEYLEFYVEILSEISIFKQCPLKIKHSIATSYLELTSAFNQQLSRFIVYKLSCRSIVALMGSCSSNVVMNFFQYTWFINRARDDSDLFRSEFLIMLLHEYFSNPRNAQIHDMLSLCHYLLDWQCSSKEETHIPTIKFAFDMYLQFLKEVANVLGEGVEKYIQELIERCNEPKMYVLFKFKLIATFVRLDCYKSLLTYSETKLDLSFLEGEVSLFMMPKNPKPIFDLEYSLTADGEIESRKEIETIKVIMDLLNAVMEVHQQKQGQIIELQSKYHEYLSELEQQPGFNRDLIHCLVSLGADNYFTECQRSFLLSLIDERDNQGNNLEYTLDGRILFSPLEAYDTDQEYNIFGGMSPVHLKMRILGGRSYSSVFIEIKKSQWVTVPEMKLIISTALEVREIPFESCVVEMKVDRVGLINFEAWTTEGTALMLGSGSHRLNRSFKWLKVDHLKLIDGIRSKAFLSQSNQMAENMDKGDNSYLTYCFGEPVLVQIIYSRNQIVVTVANKEIWMEIQEFIATMLEELTDGTAEIIDRKALQTEATV